MKLTRAAYEKAFFPLLILISLAGLMLILYATRWGAALSDDSYFYIKPARDMLAGQPYRLSPHYAPSLPYVLTAIGRLGVDPQNGIRYLNAFCFGLNIFLAGSLVRRISGRAGAGAAAALLVMLAQPMIEVHAWAMSEALFLTFILGCFSALQSYFESESWLWLLLSAVLAGFAALTRYAGVAMIAAGAAGLFLAGPAKFPRRVLSSVVFALVAGLMFGAYAMSDQAASGEIARFGGLQLINPSGQSLTDLLYNTLLWVAPGRLVRGREELAMAGLTVVVIGIWIGYAKASKTPPADLDRASAVPSALVLLLFALASLFLLYQANLSNTYRSPFDFRLLAPSHLALLLFAFSIGGMAWEKMHRLLRVVMILVVIFLTGLYLQRAVDTVRLYHDEGMGFASRYWHESDAIAYLRGLPAGTQLASTAPMGVYFASGREAKQVADFTPEQLVEWLQEEQGAFILFRSMPFEIYGKDEHAYLSKLRLVQEFSDSAVYQAP